MITGKKVYFTAIESSSLEQLRAWRNTPDLRQYFREYREISSDMQKKWFYERVLENKNQVDFEIHDIQTNSLIGHCSLNYIDWINKNAEFGIYIGDTKFRSGGFGSDALRLLLEYGFNTLNLHRIWGEVYSNNSALDIYYHVGFKNEGLKRQHHFDAGQWLDSHMIAILRDEWNNKNHYMLLKNGAIGTCQSCLKDEIQLYYRHDDEAKWMCIECNDIAEHERQINIAFKLEEKRQNKRKTK